MTNNRYISSYEIIGNVLRDTQYSNLELDWSSAIEWCAEVIDLIAVPSAMRNDISCVKIHNYRGLLPCNFDQMTQCSGSMNGGRQFPMIGAGNTFHPVFTCDDKQVTSLSTQGSTVIDPNIPVGTDINGNPVFNFVGSNTDDTAMPLETTEPPFAQTFFGDATYKINDNYIFTNFKEGSVYMAYTAFPIDEAGFPLIPDNIKYKMAVQWYIISKVDYILYRRGDITRDIYEKSVQEYCFYVGAAQNSMRIPTIDQMQSIQNMIVRLIPRLNQHSQFFANMNTQEQLNFGSRRNFNSTNTRLV